MLAGQLFFTNSNQLLHQKKGFLKDDKRVELSLSFPYRDGKQVDKDQDFSFYAKVVIKNNTDTVASFYEDWNMWGYFNITFQIHSTKGIDTLHKKMRDWDKNFPSYQTLFPGDSMVLFFQLRDTRYQNSPFKGYLPEQGQGLLGIKAIYQLQNPAMHAEISLRPDSIQYRYKKEEEPLVFRKVTWGRRRGYRKEPVIIDSLSIPIEAKRTFPLVKLESQEVRF